MFPSISNLEPKHITEVIVAQLFRLQPGTSDYINPENPIILREFLDEPLRDSDKDSQMVQLKTTYFCYPFSVYREDTPHFYLIEQVADDCNWREDFVAQNKLDQIVFERAYLTKAPGCQHRVSTAELHCPDCNEFFGCRYCHDELDLGHYMDVAHVSTVRCRYCNKIQPFHLICDGCGIAFGLQEMLCLPCKRLDYIGRDVRPSVHCDKCNRCYCALPGQMRHCEKCNTCYKFTTKKKHICQPDMQCVACFDSVSQKFQMYMVLECGHVIHRICRDKMLCQWNFRCPICRKTVILPHEKKYYYKQIAQMAGFLYMTELDETVGHIQCLQCGACFFDLKNQLGIYHCPQCNEWNCSNEPQPEMQLTDEEYAYILSLKHRLELFLRYFYEVEDPQKLVEQQCIDPNDVHIFLISSTYNKLAAQSLDNFLLSIKNQKTSSRTSDSIE